MDTSREIPYRGRVRARFIAALLLGLLALAPVACGDEAQPGPSAPRMDFQVKLGSCRCTKVTRYVILILGTDGLTHLPCLYYSESAQPGQEEVMQGLSLTEGQSLDVSILAYCSDGDCVTCATKKQRVVVQDQGSVDLELTSSAIPCVGSDPLVSPSIDKCR